MEEDDESHSACAVCACQLVKPRVHYGGVTCYSCRAFFRRSAQRPSERKCKRTGNCDVIFSNRKQCGHCRYRKCLRIGMTPNAVLSEDEKKVRFRKKIQKSREEQQQSSSVNLSNPWIPSHSRVVEDDEDEEVDVDMDPVSRTAEERLTGSDDGSRSREAEKPGPSSRPSIFQPDGLDTSGDLRPSVFQNYVQYQLMMSRQQHILQNNQLKLEDIKVEEDVKPDLLGDPPLPCSSRIQVRGIDQLQERSVSGHHEAATSHPLGFPPWAAGSSKYQRHQPASSQANLPTIRRPTPSSSQLLGRGADQPTPAHHLSHKIPQGSSFQVTAASVPYFSPLQHARFTTSEMLMAVSSSLMTASASLRTASSSFMAASSRQQQHQNPFFQDLMHQQRGSSRVALTARLDDPQSTPEDEETPEIHNNFTNRATEHNQSRSDGSKQQRENVKHALSSVLSSRSFEKLDSGGGTSRLSFSSPLAPGYPPASTSLSLASVHSSYIKTSRQKPIPQSIPPPCPSSLAIDLSNNRSFAAEPVTVVIPSVDQVIPTVSQSFVRDSTTVVSVKQPIPAVIPAAPPVAANESTGKPGFCMGSTTPPPRVPVNAHVPVLGFSDLLSTPPVLQSRPGPDMLTARRPSSSKRDQESIPVRQDVIRRAPHMLTDTGFTSAESNTKKQKGDYELRRLIEDGNRMMETTILHQFKYHHKKFRKKDKEVDLDVYKENSKRQSVIVSNACAMAGPEEQHVTDAGLLLGTQESGGSSPADETQVQTEHGVAVMDDKALIEFVFSLEINHIEVLYTAEETKFLESRCTYFWKQWSSFNLGSEVLSIYIDWLRHGGELNPAFFIIGHRQLRERLIVQMVEFDDVSRLTEIDYSTLLRRNVNYATILFTVWNNTHKSPIDMASFALGAKDFEYFKKENLPFKTVEQMINNPELVMLLRKNSFSFYSDRSLFFLMVAIILYDPKTPGLEEPEYVATIRDEYITILRRYLARHCTNFEEKALQQVFNTIDMLPRILECMGVQ